MTVNEARRLAAYNRWANRRLLVAASLLAPIDFTRDLHSSFGSVRGTLVHILWVERRWLRFWQDGTFIPDADPDEYQDAAALQAAWDRVEQDQQSFAAELTDAKLAGRLTVNGQQHTLGDLLQNSVTHSTYHRGQLAAFLRQLGHTPPPTDYLLFLAEARDIGLEV
jgi:uncharacterized damage-inducible protein DinB